MFMESQTIPLGVDPDETQLFPSAVYYILDTEIQLAAHDHRVWLACKLIEEVKADAVNLVVSVETVAYFSK